jgi:Fic family protein
MMHSPKNKLRLMRAITDDRALRGSRTVNMVAVVLLENPDRDGSSRLLISEIAAITGRSNRTIKRTTALLVAAGYFEETANNGRGKAYRPNFKAGRAWGGQ